MHSNRIAIVLAVIVVFGFAFYHYGLRIEITQVSPSATITTPATDNTAAPSTATNYDECIAEGNVPLADASDKCLTKDGHLFIKGVVEQ